MHYAVRDAFKPVMVSAVNADDAVELYVVSDLLEDKKASLEITIMDFEGNAIFDTSNNIVIKANTSTRLETIDLNSINGLDKKYNVMVLKVVENDSVLCSKNHYFEHAKDLRLPKPGIDVSVSNEGEDTYLHIHSNALVRNLYLYDSNSQLMLNDNYFDVLPGQRKKIKVLKGSQSVSSSGVNFRYISR